MKKHRRRCFIAFCVMMVGVVVSSSEIYDNLRQRLADNQWDSLIGNSDGNFTITYPTYEPPSSNNGTHRVYINAPQFEEKFQLELHRSPKMVSDDFLMFETFANASSLLPVESKDLYCFYRGTNAALSLCDGVRGIVHVNQRHYYAIYPLSKKSNSTLRQLPHLLIRNVHERKSPIGDYERPKPEGIFFASNQTKDSITKVKLKTKNSQKMGKTLKRRRRDTFPIGATVFVETAVFVDRDLFDHMKINFPVDTEREVIRFVLAMINAVQLLYHDPSLGRPVNFVLKRLEILKEEMPGLARPPDIDRFLSNFCNWQRTKNPAGDREPLHWDHALILTGLDLYVRGKHGKISNQVVGLAPVAGMCTPTSSCTVNEGRHFESVYVVAHEIGHNLGMRHDGPLADNDCDPSSYIMSPTLGSGKITWSPCSKRYLQKFLDTPQSRCLLDHGSSAGQLDHGAEGALPGERFDANQQCMLKYGKGSKHSSQQPLDDVCRDLHCEKDKYTWTSHPALEGTYCGSGMWCRGGRCITKSGFKYDFSGALKQTANLEEVHGGWSQWRDGECASGCLFGEEGRLRTGSTGIMISDRACNNPSPEGKGNKCDGPRRKYQTCNAQQCLNVPRLTIREFAEQICTRARDVDKDLTGSGMQKISSDPEEACTVWCQKRNGSTKSRGWTFPDGTACQTRRKSSGLLSFCSRAIISSYFSSGRASYCITGRCEDFVCDSLEDTVFSLMPELCPVDRANNDINWRYSLRVREGVIRWKSASGCHFNCISPGSGIRLVMNKKSSKPSIQLCQPDQFGCGKIKSPFEHASMICTKYKGRVRRLSGLGMQISASFDPDRPCKVACQDENISHRFYLVNGEDGWFPFGTDCTKGSHDKKSYCVSGKCLGFGSDDTPLSESEFTLPLLSRSRRSLQRGTGNKIIIKLNQEQLDEIIDNLNRTILGYTPRKIFEVDLNNPIHVNKDVVVNASGINFYYDNDFATNDGSINF
ncbi:A disintegrin and metalloproteinase with thrombospondin motifs adt-1 isoform X2 [Cylas formicarius]|uniref:A disintegrin and metalloproteinase with thrombospondin motifs adt-1 isoform X2 n=1 Tax=Cylas formicarius TaxID=197179 RepID=UPI0029584D98|nr:A disintegrin and metalloproteinase with thrombospondin motifs adt-1 isoform X2 [Cylas formicarius]